MIKFIVIVSLVGIVASLGVGLFHLVSDKGESKRMVHALTLRIGLSAALFVFLLLAWSMGWIEPRGFGK